MIQDINGRLLTVNKAAPKGSQPERIVRTYEPSFRVYVGNLPWQVDDNQLIELFSEHGKVVDAKVVYDRESGRSRGFGFVTMSTELELNDAIAALDGQVISSLEEHDTNILQILINCAYCFECNLLCRVWMGVQLGLMLLRRDQGVHSNSKLNYLCQNL